jgi:hypothetical protein
MKRFWTFIKHKRSDDNTVPPLKSEGLLHSNPIDKADILNKQLQKAFSPKTNFTEEQSKSRCEMRWNYPIMEDINITVNGIEQLLFNLNIHKAAAPDRITSRMIKQLAAPIFCIYLRHHMKQDKYQQYGKRHQYVQYIKREKL